MCKIIYAEDTLNYMLREGKKSEVDRIIKTGEHKNRKSVNYVVLKG